MRPAYVLRGAYLIVLTDSADPRSISTTLPLAAGPSKNVDGLPSVALATVFPSFWYDPAVPVVVPVRWAKVVPP